MVSNNGILGREDFVKVDVSLLQDVFPEDFWNVGTVRVSEDTLFGEAEVEEIVSLEFKALPQVGG